MNKISKAFIVATIFFPAIAFAQGNDDVNALYGLVGRWYYSLILPLGSVLAGIVILVAGIMYAASGGDSTKTGKAKELIIGAITGLILLVGAATIIRSILY